MADRIYVYIDGESHFHRSEAAWKKLCNDTTASLERLRYVGQTDSQIALALPDARVFWTRKFSAGFQRAVYFTSVVCNPENMHDIKVQLRTFNLDPHVILEPKPLRERRDNLLRDSQIIEKPKGIDIALTVQMLEDSRLDYDVCHLYTSDVDFIPLIQAVRSRGKQVFVYGFKNGLGKKSELLTVPDLFVDLEDVLRTECELEVQK